MCGGHFASRFAMVSGLILVVAVVAFGATAAAQDHVIIIQADNVTWQSAPASFPPGAQLAVLEGDPAKSGPVTIRLKLPGGYKFPPHWHSMLERVTVLSGTFHAASGDVFDTAKATALGPGGLVVLPAKHHHYAWVDGETVVQVHLNGPFDIFYVNAADDPRRVTSSH